MNSGMRLSSMTLVALRLVNQALYSSLHSLHSLHSSFVSGGCRPVVGRLSLQRHDGCRPVNYRCSFRQRFFWEFSR